VVPALVVALAGCGQSGGPQMPDLTRLPLLSGARIVARVTRCDKGANAFCALELVVADPQLKSSDSMLLRERDRLRALGWSAAYADTGEQKAADSPGHKLRVTYATAYGDLKGIDLGWIHRSQKITLALSQALFSHSPTLSMMLELGST
jgi:hypothetical protein